MTIIVGILYMAVLFGLTTALLYIADIENKDSVFLRTCFIYISINVIIFSMLMFMALFVLHISPETNVSATINLFEEVFEICITPTHFP